MKKLILVVAAIAITAGVYAQIDSTNKKMNPSDINNQNEGLSQNQNLNNNPNQVVLNKPADKSLSDGVMMQNGKMLKVVNGKTTNLSQDMTMSNGTKILSDGNYTKKNGNKMMLKEGQHMDMSGNIILMKENKDKNTYLLPDSTKRKN